MDPVSQTQASETLAARGYGVIGWYHSHPAFDPNPSIRDIDTQAKYQVLTGRLIINNQRKCKLLKPIHNVNAHFCPVACSKHVRVLFMHHADAGWFKWGWMFMNASQTSHYSCLSFDFRMLLWKRLISDVWFCLFFRVTSPGVVPCSLEWL